MADRNIYMELYKSIVDNKIYKLWQLLKEGVDANHRFEDKHLLDISDTVFEFTPLHLACQYGNLECVKTLLENGADLYALDQWKETPLMYTLPGMHHHVTEYLLEKDPSIANDLQWELKSCIHLTIENKDFEGTELLLRYGATPTVFNKFMETPLHLAAALSNGERFIRLLLKNGGDEVLDQQDRRRKTPLHYAVESGDTETVILLLKHKANPNITDFRGFVPFMYCVFELAKYPEKKEQLKKLRILLKAGSDVNTIGNERGQTVLHLVASPELHCFKNECTSLFLELLQSGADVNIRDVHGCTPLLLALSRKFESIAKCLIAYNCDVNIEGELREIGGEYYSISPFRVAYKNELKSVLEFMFHTGLLVTKQDRLHFIFMDSVELMDQSPLFFSWLYEKLEHPNELTILCRNAIRKRLGRKFKFGVHQLGLPSALEDFLLLRERAELHDLIT